MDDDETECPTCETRYTLIYNTRDAAIGNCPNYCPFCGCELDEEEE